MTYKRTLKIRGSRVEDKGKKPWAAVYTLKLLVSVSQNLRIQILGKYFKSTNQLDLSGTKNKLSMKFSLAPIVHAPQFTAGTKFSKKGGVYTPIRNWNLPREQLKIDLLIIN